ncbi:FN3 domain-containing metallophosphoesterase family protein [Verrucomicrobium spinosum]|uniref:FN3 domain-containing metallophosphoesterase family protein n=1 Tax=Verrucomicrobium spinosum TaxID=2736 RepID=UPI00094648D9|nr:FN3 domain-containing metallophosphoesterase family protein [Verrucomicrobium spinosum]
MQHVVPGGWRGRRCRGTRRQHPSGGGPAPEAAPFGFASAPVLTHPAEDAVSILWATNGFGSGWIEYGETAALGQKAGGADGGLMPYDERTFKIRLQGLKPGTTYHYRVGASPVNFRNAYKIERGPAVYSAVHTFRTLNASAEETTFTVWNDTHEQAETLQKLHALHQEKPGDFLLWNGDVTNDIYKEEKMVEQYLSPKGVAFATGVPYFFVRGNHDVRGPAARHLPASPRWRARSGTTPSVRVRWELSCWTLARTSRTIIQSMQAQ